MKYNAPSDWILAERLTSVRTNYLGSASPMNPLASPVYGNLDNFPPVLIQVGTHELLLDDIRLFVSKLKSHHNIVQYEEWEGMFHCWQIFASVVKEGNEAINAIGEFAKTYS